MSKLEDENQNSHKSLNKQLTELGARVRANYFASRSVALEEQDVKRVCHLDELLLGDLLLAPELLSFWCDGLFLEASRRPNMQVNDSHPVRSLFLTAGLEPELTIVAIECDFELTTFHQEKS